MIWYSQRMLAGTALAAALGLLLISDRAWAITTGGTATASSQYNADNAAAKAVDGDATTYGWGNNNLMPSWWRYDFNNSWVVTNYGFRCSSAQSGGWNSESYNPKTWNFQGSQDGTSWTNLDSIADGLITMNVWKYFPVTNTVSYLKYRIYITAAESGNWVHLTEFEMLYYGLLAISNSPAVNIAATNASLVGNLLSNGGSATEVYCYWGGTDGGTNKTDWANTNYLGTNGIGLLTNNVTGLSGATRYYYAFYATNTGGDAWGTPSVSFSTAVPLPSGDGFEGYPNGTDLNGTNGWTATANNRATVQTNVVYAGAQAARFTNAVLQLAIADAGASNVWTRLYLRPVFGENVTPSDNSAVFYVNDNGVVVAYNGTNAVTLSNQPIVSNTWVRFVARSDYVQKKWWLWLDGANIAANFGFYSANAALYTKLSLDGNGETNAAYLDDVNVSANSPSSPGVSFSAASDSQSESLTTITGAVFLSWAATNTITVTFTNTAGTAGAADFSGAGTITFNPGETNKDFTFAIVNDTEDEYPNETVVFSLIGLSNAVLGAITNFTYTIDDSSDGVALPFAETFETLSVGNLNNQHGWTATDSVAQTNVVYAGGKAASSTNSGEMSHAFSDSSSRARTEIYIQPQLGDAPTNVPSDSTAAFYVGTNGIVTAYDGTNATALSNDPIATNAWVRFAWLSDYTQKKWTLWLNGTNIAQDYAFYSTNKTSYTTLGVAGGSDQAYLDSISIIVPPVVDNDGGAKNVKASSAWLNGNLISTGGALTTVYIYWGLTDGGATNGNWGNTTNLGVLSTGLFSNQVTSLIAGTTYYYRCYATNSVGQNWAVPTRNFITPAGTLFKFY